ncbi:DUF4176 domain-containing protein [Bacillus mycoides]|jgi:hypothetical protein|uniref:Cytoplasmic protein n=3 Tax=Bacillus cereus group TaxID=86661 RepID=A0A243ACB6_BACTU|nr:MULTISPECIES: DUF4176 domain-containing protein [Bacillus cereus group]EJQ68870.1 hypothetical protein IG7_03215 [Bacillus cereus HuA2-4]EJS58386.1 hypothetical protein ICG_02125 [Bacillus cereus BAG1X1-3]EOO73163.1 hypothetical protein IC7_02777 [Bacillus cereus BAG1O-1]KXY43481.1 hypothetical protein AT257_03920 [Bacillus cereus]RAN90028.1 hypothetical protein B5P41_10445 [Bacillus sp. SRB_28]
MNSQLFPIGSIVILKEGTKKLMIFGRKQQVETDEVRKFDYMGCPYPEGYMNPDFTYLFNHDDIQEVVSTGYEDQEERTFQENVLSKI